MSLGTSAPASSVGPTRLPSAPPPVPFGVNEVRLQARHWLVVFLVLVLVMGLVPWVWTKVERFDTGPDYRVAYELSKDYWLYHRRLQQAAQPGKVVVLGDSVVWGEYVLPSGTLTHFLNAQANASDRFINGGLNGLFPLAEEGLMRCYGGPLRNRKVIVHYNLLWMTSPKADLSSEKEEPFNHSRLVPQFFPRIPCYKADANERLSSVLQGRVSFLGWVQHLQSAYYGQKSILRWTLEEDGGDPPRLVNANKNPLGQIDFRVPTAPTEDPLRGPESPRHKPWSTTGVGTARFEWVGLEHSLQWQAFQRMLEWLRSRGDDVLVIVGPFNEHMMAEENRPGYHRILDGVIDWLGRNQIPNVVPELLPSALYADASHPLTEGYQLLAKRIYGDATFQKWLGVAGKE